MNHDYAHCLDYKKGKCLKKKCFRAELVDDLKNYIGDSSIVTWASLRGTKYCEMEWQENRMDDLISRQAAVYAVDDMSYAFGVKTNAHLALIKALAKLPSAERHGMWVDVEPAPHNLFYATCSVCGERQTIEVANYCPMCGSSMDEVSE